ncbi:TonB-dependent receptor [Janthinobacterium agaricidamnosum]|uniref:TonB-dependent receptor family protein n=1 Tax=Janthinobacterium agaricidamnosum NBRC 102515 = DSM 9628 TaxID=1349767 RepID=W0VBU3_9BURK|nr:TonB-dependent receptor [Janthinobacterium agaricidamnosum]CDG84767.1 tonB-dependent receptor family protein [Janthinobacterium agaricidamnosum NBRC 102515 = DSM 9628]
MNSRLAPVLTPVAAAVALLAVSIAAQAQQTAPVAPDMQEIVVTGIRASLQQSLNQKRNSDSVIDVITAEDIGKLPDKNVADAVQRVPGVNISSSAGGEGGFSENDRVSIRGTSPSLTQTLINGHAVGTGDWFVTDQVGTVGRSVSFALLPAEIVSRVTVQKSAQADLVEGGVAGSINIETRKPLSFKNPFTAELSLQAIHADLPDKTDPQISALFNWRNEQKNLGVMLQVFSQKRHERRDGQEFFGYGEIDANSPAAKAHPELAGVLAPLGINSALFEQVRKRTGGSIDIQLKPNADWMLDLNGFTSKLDAANYNRSFYNQPGANLNAVDNNGNHVGVIPSSYTIKNNTLVAADIPASQYPAANGTTGYNGQLYPALVDQIYRPGSNSSTGYLDFNASYRASDRLRLSGSAGYTRGIGETPVDLGYEAGITGIGVSYKLNGLSAAQMSFPGLDISKFGNVVTASAWGSQVKTLDTEKYAQADGELSIGNGIFESAKFGVRYNEHHRNVAWPENRSCALCDGTTNAPLPVWNGGTYPGNYGSGLGGGPKGRYWQLDPAALQAWADKYDTSGGPNSQNWPAELDVREKNSAIYAMANLAGDKWRGNVGVRVVRTQQATITNVPGGENPIGQNNVFGLYTPTLVEHTYTDVLPSANFKFDLSPQLVARAAVAKTMARADYSALVGAVNLNDQLLTGTGGNPDLKPIRSTNYDATLEWYFAPKAMLSVGAFYMDMSSYVTFGTAPVTYYNNTFKKLNTYVIQSPTNIGAKNKGVELSYQQGLWGGFGVVGNYTYTDGKAADGAAVVGSSKGTYNVEGYYEDAHLSARLAYTYRSSFLAGLFSSSPQYVAGTGNLAASLNYKINETYSLTFDVLNLNNAVLKYYGANKDQPTALYSNGRQYYFGLRAKI